MENRINIAELLKDCPSGMELDCTTWENVTFEEVVNNGIYIKRNNKESLFDKIVILNQYGCITSYKDEKCRIFPKGKTTWEGFVPPCKFKDGDIIFTHANCLKVGVGNTWISIFKERRNGGVATYVDYAEDGSDYYSDLDGDKALLCMESDILRQRLATEEEKSKLFQAIKDNGYKWNPETKTLEKLIIQRFKVGDRVKKNKDYISGIVTNISDDDSFKVEYQDGGISYVSLAYQDEWELVHDKFDINTLKTFDQVLVRLTNNCVWMPKLFSHYDTDSKGKYYPFVTTDNLGYPQCIPYNGNEHLCRTTNNCDEFYRVWEK